MLNVTETSNTMRMIHRLNLHQMYIVNIARMHKMVILTTYSIDQPFY